MSRLVWIYGIGMVAFSAMTSVLALYLGAKFGLTEKTIGWIFAYVGALSLVMRSLLLGPIVDRLGESWTMRSGALLLATGLLLYPIPQSLWPLAAVIPLVPIGTALLFPATTSLMSRYSDPSELGTTMGVAQTFRARAAGRHRWWPRPSSSAWPRLAILRGQRHREACRRADAADPQRSPAGHTGGGGGGRDMTRHPGARTTGWTA